MALNLDAIGRKIGPLRREYSWKDIALYALGVGAGFDQLEYVYEDRLKVLPSFSIAAIFDFLAETASAAAVDLSGILHGEQDIIFHRPIPVEGALITEGRVTHIYDKGKDKGALVIAQADTFHSDGAKLFTNIFTLFARKDGGFGGQPGPSPVVEIPDREPDLVEPDLPSPDQPLLYRLSGDIFTLHVDPEFAQRSGFEKPIMHGLCTHGFACRAVIKHLMPGHPERMTRFKLRFSQTLYPGVPIETRIWRTGPGRAVFQTVNQETGQVVLDQGVVEWLNQEQAAQRDQRGAIDFSGRVALVTGAGAGLGRDYALALAARGAAVVVNDLGGASDGSGASTRAADLVVEEITKAGGQALANYDSVATAEGGTAMVKAALTAFGRLDIVINNAGILRDKTLAKLEPADWQAVLAVHLDGAYHVTRAAWEPMRSQGYGRMVFTTSAAGLHGNFGQSNYSAAKLGLVGLMNTLKLEGAKYDIKVNTVAPIAGTRLTEGILPPEMFQRLRPQFITPLVLYLCAEQCPVTGSVYNAGGGYFNRAALAVGPGVNLAAGEEPPSPEQVAAQMERIKSLAGCAEYDDATAALSPMMAALEGEPAAAAPQEQGDSVAGVFARMPDAFDASAAQGVAVIFQFEISGPQGGTWRAVIQDGACTVASGAHESPTTTIKMKDQDFLQLIAGQLNPMTAYTSGRLKIKGDLMKSQLITKLFKF